MAGDPNTIPTERGFPRPRWMLSCAAALALMPSGGPLLAQQTPPTAPFAKPPVVPTLHVYENLMQVPVLVLNPHYERMKPLDTSKFRLSLDSGPLFRPAYVRQEGDDPISLAILIDASNPESDLLPLSSAIAALVPDYLQPRDHVSIYAISCGLFRTAYDAPANAAALKASVEDALFAWRVRHEQKGPPPLCKSTMPLWDSMANVLNQLDRQRGRRVLLAITDGHDAGSRTPWTHILHQGQLQSTAVFGLVLTTQVIGTEYRSDTGETFKITIPVIPSPEDKFNQICELTGGVEIQARSPILSVRLKEFTRTVRERYILEFSRSRDQRGGVHSLQVSYLKRNNYYLVSSGIAVPVASDDEIKGANTVPTDPSKSPVEGNRRVLLPPTD